MKKSELKEIINEAINEVMQESAPKGFPPALEKKLLAQYKDNPAKAYATMWTIHNKKNEGDQRVNEMWMAWEKKDNNQPLQESSHHDETDMTNPEERKEVEITNKIKKHVDALLKMHGKMEESSEERDMSDPAEKKEVEHATEIKKLADELLKMHKSSKD